MTEMLAGVSAGTVTLVLLAGFAGHLLNPRVLPAALTAHRTLPPLLVWPTAIAVTVLEGLLGALTGYGLLAGRTHALSVSATGCVILLTGYAVYGLYVLRTRPRVPCGCAADGTPMSGWVAGRAAALALASMTAAVGAGSTSASHDAHVAVVALSSIVFAVVLWLLPLAMTDPERRSAG